MGSNVLLRTPLAIEWCVQKEVPDVVTQLDDDQKKLIVTLPGTLDLPSGARLTISTSVLKLSLTEAIRGIYQCTLLPEEAERAISTNTPLSGWAETKPISSYRARRREYERRHGSCAEAMLPK